MSYRVVIAWPHSGFFFGGGGQFDPLKYKIPKNSIYNYPSPPYEKNGNDTIEKKLCISATPFWFLLHFFQIQISFETRRHGTMGPTKNSMKKKKNAVLTTKF